MLCEALRTRGHRRNLCSTILNSGRGHNQALHRLGRALDASVQGDAVSQPERHAASVLQSRAMGTWTTLEVGGYELWSTKSDVDPEVMTLFRESDRREFQ